MFTGLVSELGTVETFDMNEQGASLHVSAPETAAELETGDSVAINGVCLTAKVVDGSTFQAEVMNQTLRCTALGALSAGDRINLELPLRPADRIGGHVVQGHVDGVGTVTSMTEEGISRIVRIDVVSELLRYVVLHGSIAVDGVSLTVAGIEPDAITVALIPETLQRTSLARAREGTRLNIEVDVLAKYVEQLTAERKGRNSRT